MFTPERSALRLFRKEFTKFDGIKHIPVPSRIWSATQLSRESVPQKYSLLFGAFQVVDSSFPPASSPTGSTVSDEARLQKKEPTPDPNTSYIDFAFGSDDGYLAGVHRFIISRERKDGRDKEMGLVTVEFAHTGHKPRTKEPLGSGLLQDLHMFYAMVLFREGVAEILKD